MAIRTQGTLVEVSISSVWTAIGEITSFDGPGGESGEIDTTHLQSTAREKLTSLPDEGDFSFDANFVPTNTGQAYIRAIRYSGAQANFRLTLSDGSIASFAARCKSFSIAGAVDDKVTCSISLAINGQVSWS